MSQNPFKDIALRNFDQCPSTLTLNYKSVRQYRSFLGGALSIIFSIFAITFITFKIIFLIQKGELSIKQITVKNNDISPLEIKSGNFKMCFYQSYQEDGKTKYKKIKFADRFKYGLNVTVRRYSVYFNQTTKDQGQQLIWLPLIQCQQQEDQYHKLQQYFCSPSIINLITKYLADLIGHPIITHSTPNMFEICDPNIQIACNQYKKKLYTFFILSNNNISLQSQKNENVIQKNVWRRPFQSNFLLQTNSLIKMQFQLKRVIVQTDLSLIPQFINIQQIKNTKIQNDWIFDEQFAQDYSISTLNSTLNNTLFKAQLKRSVYTQKYQRKYTKLDTALGQIFGVLGLASIIIFGFYRGYNQYAFEQKIRKSLKLKNERPSIFKYYRYACKKLAYRWCGPCFKNTKGYINEKQAMQMIFKKLDVSKFEAIEFQQTDTESQFVWSFHTSQSQKSQNNSQILLQKDQSNRINKSTHQQISNRRIVN